MVPPSWYFCTKSSATFDRISTQADTANGLWISCCVGFRNLAQASPFLQIRALEIMKQLYLFYTCWKHLILSVFSHIKISMNCMNQMKKDHQTSTIKSYIIIIMTCFFLRLKYHTFIGLNVTRDCTIYLYVRLVNINIRQYGRRFDYSSRHFIIFLYTWYKNSVP